MTERNKEKLIELFIKAREEGKLEEGQLNEYEQAGCYLHSNTKFEWDEKWMDEYKDWWLKVKELVNKYQ